MTCDQALRSANIKRHEALLILSHATGKSKTEIAVNPFSTLSDTEEEKFTGLLNERRSHIPLQYLLGCWQFMGLDFYVNPRVLIPRQDTETLVETAIKYISAAGTRPRVLDLCTGSGCIAVSIAHYTNAIVTAADISPEALAVAKRNAEHNGVSGRASFCESDLFGNIQGVFDMIISNPPYIPTGELPFLQPEVKDHEPILALDGGADGLDFYRKIISGAKSFLTAGGILLLEAGDAEGIRGLLETNDFEDIETVKDLAGKDRVVTGVMPAI